MATRKPGPWQRPAPKQRGGGVKLTAVQVEEARARAEAAGRRYPNLVDNMHVAAKARREGPAHQGATEESE